MLCTYTVVSLTSVERIIGQWREETHSRSVNRGQDQNPPPILEISVLTLILNIKPVKDEKSLYRHGEAQRVPGGQGSQIRENQERKLVRMSALDTGRLYPPGNNPGAHFC